MSDEMLISFKSVADIYFTVETVISEGGEVLHKLTVNRYISTQKRVAGTTIFRVEPRIGTVVEISEVA